MEFILTSAKIFIVLNLAKTFAARANNGSGLIKSFLAFMSCFLPVSMIFFFLQEEEGGVKEILTGWLTIGSVGFVLVMALNKIAKP